MPELPEIINFKQYVDATSLHQEIERIEIHNENILDECTRIDLQDHLLEKQFESASTHGKYLFIHTDEKRGLTMHFGMTGEPVYYKKDEERPEYARAEFRFNNGFWLAFNCMRMLGSIALFEDKKSFIEKKELGPDVYEDSFVLKDFSQLLDGRRGMIKSALMDQSLMAGIGNECSDEILYQARIHPKTKVSDLDDQQLQKLYKTMQEVLRVKIESNRKIENLPEEYILRHREEGADCPRCSGSISQVSVGGRTGYFCPNCQG